MDTSGIDLADRFDAAFKDEPGLPDAAFRLGAGRKALRRRRASVTVIAAGFLTVLSLAVGPVHRWTATTRGDFPVADATGRTGAFAEMLKKCGAAVDGNHEVVVLEGARVLDRVDGVAPPSAALHSSALDIELPDGQRRWVMLGWDDGTTWVGGCDDPERSSDYGSFAAFSHSGAHGMSIG